MSSDLDYEEQAAMPDTTRSTIQRTAVALKTAKEKAAASIKNLFIATTESVENTTYKYKKWVTKMDEWAERSRVGRSFLLKERRTKLSIEIRSGIITFLMVAYILALNPQILSVTGGSCNAQELCDENSYKLLGEACLFRTDDPAPVECITTLKLSLTTATAATSLISTFIMGFFANLPLALAPGMGINIYLAYQVVAQGFLTYQQALTAIFVEAFIFMALSMSGIRSGLIRLMPQNISFATSVGIGLLLAFTGLRNMGVVVFDANTLVTLGGCSEDHHSIVYSSKTLISAASIAIATESLDEASPAVYACDGGEMQSPTMWLGISGGFIMALLTAWSVKGALFIGIAYITIISWIPGHSASYLGADSSIPGGAIRMNIFKQVVAVPTLEGTGLEFDWSAFTAGHFWIVLFTFLYIDLLDCTGILLSMANLLDDVMRHDAEEAGQLETYQPFLNNQKEFRGQQWAFLSDGLGILCASMMGVTPVSVYMESAAGIEDGARTGISALILVGVMLIAHVDRLNWDDPLEAVPAFLTIIMMPFTLSVAYGIIAGLVAYIALRIPSWLYRLCTGLYGKHIKPRFSKEEEDDEEGNHTNSGYHNNGPSASPTPSNKNFRRRAIHRKVFGNTSGSEDGSVTSFRSRTYNQDEAPFDYGQRIGISSNGSVAGTAGLRRSLSHGSLKNMQQKSLAQSHIHGSHQDLAGYEAAIMQQRHYGIGSRGGGMPSTPTHGKGKRLTRVVSDGANLLQFGQLSRMPRSRTYTDIEAAAALARARVAEQEASEKVEQSGSDVKLFGDFELLDIDLGSSDEDDNKNNNINSPSATNQPMNRGESINKRESLILSTGPSSGSSADLSMFKMVTSGPIDMKDDISHMVGNYSASRVISFGENAGMDAPPDAPSLPSLMYPSVSLQNTISVDRGSSSDKHDAEMLSQHHPAQGASVATEESESAGDGAGRQGASSAVPIRSKLVRNESTAALRLRSLFGDDSDAQLGEGSSAPAVLTLSDAAAVQSPFEQASREEENQKGSTRYGDQAV